MMNEILKALSLACNPIAPAKKEYYTDLSDVRGGTTFFAKLCEELDFASTGSETGNFLRVLFTGHLGSGKSSELEHFADELKREQCSFPHERYFPIIINALDYVDINDVSLTEILLAIAAEVADTLRTEENIHLEPGYLQKRLEQLKNALVTDINISKVEAGAGNLKAEVTALKVNQEARGKVRAALRPQMSTVLEEINIILDEARILLKSHRPKNGGAAYTDIVLIVDNLEKVIQVEGRQHGEDSYRSLFVEGASLLTSLNAHTIYTVPLILVRSPKDQLSVIYGREPFVLPNVKTQDRLTRAPFEPGRQRLRELLQKRIAQPLNEVFAEDALEFLLDYCGGHIRYLMIFVRESAAFAQTTPIPLDAVQKGVAQSVPTLYSSVQGAQWEMLAELDASPTQRWEILDAERRKLLEVLCVLEYINGVEGQDIFNKIIPWYAVHPIVRELDPFKHACELWKAKQTKT